MTTSSGELFELCKQVYEATGWETNSMFIDDTPRYTSDYLLEKLPVGTNIAKTNTNTTEPLIYYSATCRNNGIHQGGTPLQALLKLTIKLHEEEV